MDLKEKRKRLEELKKQIEEKKKEKDYYKAMQLAYKLVLNGTYGAFANKYFVCSNADIANAITAHGRDIIQYMLECIENYFYNGWHLDKEIHKKLGTEFISFKDGKYGAYSMEYKLLGRQYDKLDDLLNHKKITLYDLEEFKDNINGLEILYKYVLADFSDIKALDKNPEWGELEGRTKYVGTNQSLIYGDTDSLYVSFTPLMKSVGFVDSDVNKTRNFILHIDEIHIKYVFNKFLEDYAARFYVKNLHDFELETISKSALFMTKKHYLSNYIYEDGVFYEPLSFFYPKGIKIVRSSTPPFVRRNIYRLINYLFEFPDKINVMDVIKIVKQIKKEFELADIEDISMTTSCTNYNDRVLDDTLSVSCKTGAHFGVKAACFHNFLLNKNSEYKTKYDMLKSGRIKYYYCKHPTHNVFAYLRSFHPIEIVEKEKVHLDVDEQFDKTYLSIVNDFMKPLGLPEINKRLSVLNSLFSF